MTDYAYPEVLVDTQWLTEQLGDSTVRIVEVDMSPALCKDGHVPGAIFWNIFTDLLNPDLSINLDQAAVEKLLSRSGISAETTVIAYGSEPATGAWIFWLLKTFGHDRVYVLNGGYQKWVAEGRSLVPDFSHIPPTQYRAKSLDASLRVLQAEVQAARDQADCLLLDVRTREEYRGELFMLDPPTATERAGHIPDATHLEYTLTLNEDGTFKSAEALQKLCRDYSITSDQRAFPYCAVGGRSAHVWFVLKYLLGFPYVRNYDGSWNEWSRLPNAPVA